jgi:hypothetical protein
MALGSDESRSFRDDDARRMLDLAKEYEKSEDSLESSTESTSQGVRILSLKTTLEQRDVFDRGENRDMGVPRFGLDSRLFRRVDRIAAELQEFLLKASRLVPGRINYFQVDPEDVLIPILEGCSDLAQLLMAWEMLCSRLELGHRFFEKYRKESRLPDSIEAFSPHSTTADLTEGLQVLDNSDQKMRHMLAYYPHHNNRPRLREDVSERLQILSADWQDIVLKMNK